MAITFPSFRAAGDLYENWYPVSNSITSFTVDHPTGLAEGDLIVLVIAAGLFPDGTVSMVPDLDGYTTVAEISELLGATLFRLTVATKVATAGDVAAGSTTFDVTVAGSSPFFIARMLAYQGYAGLVGTAATLSHSGAGDGPSITVPASALVLFATLRRDDATGTAPASPSLTLDARLPPSSESYDTGVAVRSIQVAGSTTTTINFAGADTSGTRLTAVFALEARQSYLPRVTFF